jgi:hypothetical protein
VSIPIPAIKINLRKTIYLCGTAAIGCDLISLCYSIALCHSREIYPLGSGNPDRNTNYWIPAFAGMTSCFSQFEYLFFDK